MKDKKCWQYKMREENLNKDIVELKFSERELEGLRVSDFNFYLADKSEFKEIKEFVLKYEWLGSISSYPTHYFVARYNGILAGVLIFNMPNAFSKLLGEETKHLERLLSRGACASWTPKNLASNFIMWAIDYMVKNTQYRLFTAYSDPEANELGTIYQACNWIYLGQSSGRTYKYKDKNGKWVSDRKFRNVSSFKRYARENGIEWKGTWSTNRSMNWENIPNDIQIFLREKSKEYLVYAEKIEVMPKHKYCYIKGENKSETKELKKIFYKLNPKYKNLHYPKNRGE